MKQEIDQKELGMGNFQGFREKCKRRSPTSEKKRSEVEPGISMPICEEAYLHQ